MSEFYKRPDIEMGINGLEAWLNRNNPTASDRPMSRSVATSMDGVSDAELNEATANLLEMLGLSGLGNANKYPVEQPTQPMPAMRPMQPMGRMPSSNANKYGVERLEQPTQPMQQKTMRPDSFDRDDLERNDKIHEEAMRGGDDTLSYTETGDMVIPEQALSANPSLAMAAMNVLAEMGVPDPEQYIVGSEEGSYNPTTGAQEFAWYDRLGDYGKKAVDFGVKSADYIANKDWAKSAAAGGVTYLGGKLAGQDNKTALYGAAGAGLGTYGGIKLGDLAANDFKKFDKQPDYKKQKTIANNAPSSSEYVKELQGMDFKNLLSAGLGAATSIGQMGLKGGTIGLGVGNMLAPAPPAFPGLNTAPMASLRMAPVTAFDEYKNKFAANQAANLSATLPQSAPIAPLVPMAMPQGVTYQTRIRDKNTGEYRYVTDNSPTTQSAFARSMQGAGRRRGFGNMILV